MRDVQKVSLLFTHSIQCRPLLVKKADVAQDVTLYASKKEEMHVNHPDFEPHRESHTKSKLGVMSCSTKWTLVQQKNKIK